MQIVTSPPEEPIYKFYFSLGFGQRCSGWTSATIVSVDLSIGLSPYAKAK